MKIVPVGIMDVVDGRSSSIDLSSAPDSEVEPTPFAQRMPTNNSDSLSRTVGAPLHATIGNANHITSSATLPASRQDNQPVKVRKPRKKKDPSAPEPEKKEKAPRKPRVSAGATTTTTRKKPKLEAAEDSLPRQYVTNTTNLQSSKLVQPVSFPTQHLPEQRLDEVAKFSQNGFLNHDSSMRRPELLSYTSTPTATPQPQVSTPRSSAIYDPVRSVTIQRPPEPVQPQHNPQYLQTPPRPALHASTSPSISSIIDHPAPQSIPASFPLKTFTPQENPNSLNRFQNLTPGDSAGSMDVDQPVTEEQIPRKTSVSKKSTSEVPTRATSPKPPRAKEQPPPIPPGSGLLSASLFGGESSTGAGQDTEKGPTIVLHVDLKDPKNKVINFARLAEEKYGFAALYPRQAAQKERLARVAAAGAALERSASGSKFGGTSAGESGDDDLSVDIDRDSDNDGDVAMSGLNGAQDAANSGTDGPGQKRRRRRKVEEYDQDDPFVDDSEMLWEAQAAASKDGFFVYCGPLVPEGEKPAVERADGTVKRGRGRGRGGGPGSRGGRGGGNTEGGSGRGGGPGSRGGGVTRKPRITKAERLQREQEKKQRESMAPLAAKPVQFPV